MTATIDVASPSVSYEALLEEYDYTLQQKEKEAKTEKIKKKLLQNLNLLEPKQRKQTPTQQEEKKKQHLYQQQKQQQKQIQDNNKLYDIDKKGDKNNMNENDNYHKTFELLSYSNNGKENFKNTDNIDENDDDIVYKSSSGSSTEELLKLGINVSSTPQEEKLPSLSKIVDTYGPEPIILGLDSCKRFRQITPAEKFPFRMVAPAGMFNTGTNFFPELLDMNCRQIQSLRQISWGKHNPAQARDNNFVLPREPYRNVSIESVLPIVMVRHPINWMQRTCNLHYAANWPHTMKNCPHLIDTNTSSSVQVRVTYGFNLPNGTAKHTYYPSLVHLWQEWYEAYWNVSYPRLIVRLEDLVYHPKEVIEKVCHCVGGTMQTMTTKKRRYKTNSDTNRTFPTEQKRHLESQPFRVIQQSVKEKQPKLTKGRRTYGFVDSWIRHVEVKEVFDTFSSVDQQFTRQVLNKEMLNTLHYKV